MSYFLNVAYLFLLILASPWLLWAALRRGKYRQGWSQKLCGTVPRNRDSVPTVWLHAVSVGEVQLLTKLLPRLSEQLPHYEFCISTTTKTGFELAQRKFPNRTVFYCPLDFSWAVQAAIRRVKPRLLVLVELELWPNLISAAAKHRVPVAIVNGRLSGKSFGGYRRIKQLIAPTIRRLSLIAVQNEEYAERFRQLGASAESVRVVGSLKFDDAQSDRTNPESRRLAKLAGFQESDIVFLAGSTQAPEERIALEAFGKLADLWPQLRLVLVPRHPHRFADVGRLLERTSLRWQRRSQLERQNVHPAARVLLIDCIGELAAWWGTADIAYVGGSLVSRGGQNMIEPAAYGAAVSFGPMTHNFRDVVELLVRGDAAVVVRSGEQLTEFIHQCLRQPDWRRDLGQRARALVLQQSGAGNRTIDSLLPLIDPPRAALKPFAA